MKTQILAALLALGMAIPASSQEAAQQTAPPPVVHTLTATR